MNGLWFSAIALIIQDEIRMLPRSEDCVLLTALHATATGEISGATRAPQSVTSRYAADSASPP